MTNERTKDLPFISKGSSWNLNCAPLCSWCMQKICFFVVQFRRKSCEIVLKLFIFCLKSWAECRVWKKTNPIKVSFKEREISRQWFVTDWQSLELHVHIYGVQPVGFWGRRSSAFIEAATSTRDNRWMELTRGKVRNYKFHSRKKQNKT